LTSLTEKSYPHLLFGVTSLIGFRLTTNSFIVFAARDSYRKKRGSPTLSEENETQASTPTGKKPVACSSPEKSA